MAFIVGSILGVTLLTEFFKPLLMNRWFFHILLLISVGFATISSAFYLRKNGLLSLAGARRKWRYLSAMYGSTIGVNLVLFMLIFPLLANVSVALFTGAVTGTGTAGSNSSLIKLAVDIPCPGHAPLISEELKTIDGVKGVRFSFPNVFDVVYDFTKTSKQSILALGVFNEYPATVLKVSEADAPEKIEENDKKSEQPEVGKGSCCGCGGCGRTGYYSI